MPLSFDSSIPTPSNFSHFLNGPGMRIATWRHPNHSEKWDDKRDEEVIERAKENVAQFPEFTKRLVRSLRETDSH